MAVDKLAVIDLGSNSFRLVVFAAGEYHGHHWWRRVDELFDRVRIGEGLERSGRLTPERMRAGVETLEMYAHFCHATGVRRILPVATSAIRDATNRKTFLVQAEDATGLEVRVLSPTEEAHYAYVAAVNTTDLADGVVLDIGGGSLQLVRVVGRLPDAARSWPLGAVRMTERFLPDPRASKRQIRELREHVRDQLADADWLAGAGRGGRIAGVGGAVRNLAVASAHARGIPTFGIQGARLDADGLAELVDELASHAAHERRGVPGVKAERADVILAGAIVVQEVLRAGDFDAIEVTEAGMREGVFLEALLRPGGESLLPGQASLLADEEPLYEDVRRASVYNLAAQHRTDFTHAEHVARLALQVFGGLAEHGIHPGDPRERDLLWAAAMLHGIGTVIDYDDHHKHSRYLILNAGLPGYSPRETALIGQMARYHRKGNPSLGDYAPLMRDGDAAALARCAAILRVAAHLERAREQQVTGVDVRVSDHRVELRLEAEQDVSMARWGAERERELFERAFDRRLAVTVDGSR